MRRLITIFLAGILTTIAIMPLTAFAAITPVVGGGTGTSTTPGYGQVLIGGKSGEYELVASSTFGGSAPVSSVFGRIGAVIAQTGDYTTAQITEVTNLFFTNARAIAATLTGYTSGAGTISSSDSVLSAIQKLNGNIAALVTGVSSVNTQTGAVVLTTTNIAEGTNLYYTSARELAAFITNLSATTSVASITTLPNLALPATQLTGTLGVAHGGTGSTTLTGILKGAGTGQVATAVAGTDYQAPGSYITALTGDVTASGPNSAAATLATVNTNTGSWGSSTAIPNFTVNGKGLITAAGTNVVIAPGGTLSGTTLNATVINSSLTSVGTLSSLTVSGATQFSALTTNGFVQTISGNGTFTSAALTFGQVTGALGYTPSSFAYPFTSATNYNVNTAATTTPIWAQAGIMASTTSNFLAGLTIDNAGTTGAIGINGHSTTAGSSLVISDLTTAGNTFGDLINPSGTSNSSLATIPLSATIQTGSGATGGTVIFNKAAAPIIFGTGGNSFSNERMRIDGGGNVGIGTTTPWANLSIQDQPGAPESSPIFSVSSSTVGVNAFTVFPDGYIQAGPLASKDTAFCTFGKYCLGYFGSDNTLSGVNVEAGNYSSGGSAYGGFTVLNNLDDSTGSHYAFFGLTSSNYNDSTFGTSQAVPNQMQLVNSDGQIVIQANFNGTTTVPTANNIIFTVNGTSLSNEVARITPTGLGIGSTSPFSPLSVSTAAQTAATKQLFTIASTTGQVLVTTLANGFTGFNDTAPDAPITDSLNTFNTPLGASNTGTTIHTIGPNGAADRFTFDSTGAASVFTCRRNDNTAASSTHLAANENVCTFGLQGYGASGFTSTKAQLNLLTTESWSDTANGTAINFLTTPNGSTALREVGRFDQSGDLGIGTTTPWRTLDVNGTVGFKGLTTSAALQSGALCISSNNEVINDSVSCLASAGRYKQNITQISPEAALSQILKLNPVNYYYKPDFNGALQSNPNYSRLQVGLIADDVIKVSPAFGVVETATTTFEGKVYAPGSPAGVDYNEVTATLVGAVKAQQGEIDALKTARGVGRTAEENWQDIAIALLIMGFSYQQYKIRKMQR